MEDCGNSGCCPGRGWYRGRCAAPCCSCLRTRPTRVSPIRMPCLLTFFVAYKSTFDFPVIKGLSPLLTSLAPLSSLCPRLSSGPSRPSLLQFLCFMVFLLRLLYLSSLLSLFPCSHLISLFCRLSFLPSLFLPLVYLVSLRFLFFSLSFSLLSLLPTSSHLYSPVLLASVSCPPLLQT